MSPDPITRLTHNGRTPWLDTRDTWMLGLLKEVLWSADVIREDRWPLVEVALNWHVIELGMN